MLQDGATTTLPMSQNSDVTIFETTAEVKVSATGFSAQYGVGDVVYNQITKSGGDKYHGSAYEYLQNNMFNSDPYEFSTTKTGIPPLHFNNFGGSVGGPILKHKAFFFFDYDRTINHVLPVHRRLRFRPQPWRAATSPGWPPFTIQPRR